MIEINYFQLSEAEKATGKVVVVDVLRAFTTAAFAFEQGVTRIYPVAEVPEALALAEELGGLQVMGEVNGFKPEAFHFSNSPGALRGQNLSGKALVQRTSAGTKGLVRAIRADALYAASFVVARATAQAVRQGEADRVSFVITGVSERRDGDEDLACADYIAALIRDEQPDPEPYLERVLTSTVGREFASGSLGYLLQEDVQLCLELDRFDFTMLVHQVEGRLVMTPVLPHGD